MPQSSTTPRGHQSYVEEYIMKFNDKLITINA